MAIQLRQARPAEAAAVAALVRAAYREYVPRIGKEPAPMLADYPALIDSGKVAVLVAEGILAGVLVRAPAADHMFIENVAVHPDQRGRGYGRRLLERAEREARDLGLREIRLYTNAKMTENFGFYRGLGYEETGRRVEDGYARIYYRKRLAVVPPARR